MKKTQLLGILVTLNIIFLCYIGQNLIWQKSADYGLKQKAVAKTLAAQKAIGERLTGEEYTPITTTLGAKEAKLLAQNPNFAAVAVDLLSKAGVAAGDKVAINLSSSFPALNIAVIAATDALGAQPVIISSVGASTWGANRPDYTWLDMENTLVQAGIWSFKSQAAGMGGGSDQGQDLMEEGKALIRKAIERSQVPFLHSTSLEDAIAKRLAVYRKANGGNLPKALVNVGGSHVIFGTPGHGAFLRQGLTQGYRPSLGQNNGLAAAFLQQNRPVIHFINISRLAAKYDLTPTGYGEKGKAFYQLALPGYLRGIIMLWVAAMLLVLYYGKRREWWQ